MNHATSPRRRSRHGTLSLLLVVVAALALFWSAAPTATAGGAPAPRVPATPTGLPKAIEGLAPYVPGVACDMRNRTGTIKLAELVKTTYANTYGLVRSCTSATKPSEHYDGRAVDTFFNVRDTTQRTNANALISWLLATDTAGNPYANARRLGVMYIIWNNKMWSSYRTAEGWRPYSTCATTPSTAYDTTCHRNHIHISLSWEGALGRTSFWSKQVAPVDWGPCRLPDLNWSIGWGAPNPQRCPTYPVVAAPAGASALLKEMVPRSGMVLRPGMSGQAVTTLQKVIGVSATGNFLSTTTTRLKAWQTAHHLPATGITWPATWRAMLAANGMHR
ncbi:peptidoglycan-binding domain-containing protein [Terrabacter sp. 2RAF25]|uniref:peptidoglycan-binding domain-containing protein n=1 Tax=Terrabacter sp. 2RAF25 TaxID=3232998 RepID=UPI003F978280